MILFAIAAVAFGLLALAWIVYPAAMWLRGGGRRGMTAAASETSPTERVTVVVATGDGSGFRRRADHLLGLRLMLVQVMAISNGLRGRWAVWPPASQTRADLHPGA